MKTFSQFNEAFDSPYKISLTRMGSGKEYIHKNAMATYKGEAVLGDGTKLIIRMVGTPEVNDPKEFDWEIIFTRTKTGDDRAASLDATGQGDEVRVFSTVIDAIRQFIKAEDPKYIMFSAEKTDLKKMKALKAIDPEAAKKMQSREKLYSRLIKRYFSKDFKVKESTNRVATTYTLERK
jgi:hypothetical protein